MGFSTLKNALPQLNLPLVDAPLRPDGDSRRGGLEIYDGLRRRWVALTPEEWVRQHFVNWLMTDRKFPASLLGNEVGIHLNGMSRRCDTIAFGRDTKPLVIVEYKAPDVKITQDVFDQIVRYNMVLHAQYLVVSNGLNHYCCRIDYAGNTYHFIPRIPQYAEIALPFSEQ